VNSAGLSAKSAGWGFHCSNFESNRFRPVFTEFYRIRPIFLKTGGIRGSRFLVSAGFLNTGSTRANTLPYLHLSLPLEHTGQIVSVFTLHFKLRLTCKLLLARRHTNMLVLFGNFCCHILCH
jgi:hypothetical protein